MTTDDAPGVDWAAVRRDYEALVEPLKALCARHGITRHELDQRRRAEGWTPRPRTGPELTRLRALQAAHKRAEDEKAAPAGEAPAPPRRAAPQGLTPRGLARRLTGILAAQIERLEKRMAEEDGMASDEDVRRAERLAAALGRLDRVAAKAKRKKAARTDETDDGTDWRAVLKARLDRLHGQGGAR